MKSLRELFWGPTERPPVVTYRKILVEAELAKIGKLDQFFDWLKSFDISPGYNAYRAYDTANDLSDEHPAFGQFYEAALTVLGLSREDGDALLERCILVEEVSR